MIGYLIVGTALAGTGTAAYLDLKTTEVPDQVSIITAGIGLLLHAVAAYLSSSWFPIVSSIATGVGFFCIGWGLYMMGGWGGADAFVLGASGFAVPYLPAEFSPAFQAAWPFQLTLLFNVFIIGAIYSLLYASFVGLKSNEVMHKFQNRLKEEWTHILATTLIFTALSFFLALYMRYKGIIRIINFYPMLALAFSLAGMLVLYRYLKSVEEEAMKTEVDTEDLMPGDVLAEEVELGDEKISADRIKGLTEGEVVEIRDERTNVTIRHGVRFVPAFPLAILVSVTLGDLVYLGLIHSL